MQIIRKLPTKTHTGLTEVQFLHRKVNINTLEEMAGILSQKLIESILVKVCRKPRLLVTDMRRLQIEFFEHSAVSAGHLMILSISATHSYYKGAYQLRKGFLEANIPDCASAIMKSLHEVLGTDLEELDSEEPELYI